MTAVSNPTLQSQDNLSDLGSAATARANLGLGTAATQPGTAFDAAGAAAAAQAASLPFLSTSTPPASPAANDLWYDSANDLWKRYNGSGWQVADAASPALGQRPPDISCADLLFTGQSGGFTPAISGTGATGGTDTADFVLGTQAVKVTTGGAGANTKIAGTFGTALNLIGKQVVIWLKLDNLAHYLGGYPRLYLGDTGLANAYFWKLTDSSTQPWQLDGEWIRLTLPFGTAQVAGSPSRSSLAAMTLQVFDDSAGQVTVHLGGLATMKETAHWPNGVVSLTFDDGYASQFSTAAPYMDQYGFPATAYLITETLWNHGSFTGYLDLPSAQQLEWFHGWEIAAHAYTAAAHNAGYVAVGQAGALADMQAAKSYLRDQGFRAVEQFAYPLGAYDTGTIANVRRLFGSGRTISSVGGFPDETFPPADLSRLRSQAVAISTGPTLATVKSYVDQAYANKEWLVLTFHDIQASASGNKQWDTADFQALTDYIAAKGIPVRTVSDVLRSAPKPGALASDIQPLGTQAAGILPAPAAADHVHSAGGLAALPADTNLIAWNMDPALAGATNTPVAGTVYLMAVWLRATQTITNLLMAVGSISGFTLTAGENFCALFDSAGVQRGITADQTSNWGTTGAKVMALTAPYVNAPPGKYYVAFLMNGSGTTFTMRGGSSSVVPANAGVTSPGAGLRFAVNGTGQTAMPGSITPSSNTTANAEPHAVMLS